MVGSGVGRTERGNKLFREYAVRAVGSGSGYLMGRIGCMVVICRWVKEDPIPVEGIQLRAVPRKKGPLFLERVGVALVFGPSSSTRPPGESLTAVFPPLISFAFNLSI